MRTSKKIKVEANSARDIAANINSALALLADVPMTENHARAVQLLADAERSAHGVRNVLDQIAFGFELKGE